MSHPQTLLIVDDQVENLKLLSDLLKPLYQVLAATSGAVALQVLGTRQPDLCLLDIMMPEMDGYELCQQIKARPETAQTPIIFLTGKTDTPSEERGFAVGAVDYVNKPINPPLLLARVATHLSLASYTQQLRQERDEIQVLAKQLQHEIAVREQAEEQLRILAKAVEQAPTSILVTDPDGNILYANPCFFQVSGYRADEVIGKKPSIVKSGEQDRALYQTLWETISAGKIWRGELVNQTKQGRLYWESAAIAPISDDRGKITHYVAVKEEISDRKKLERIKEDVERIMRHDLKSPLNAVIALPELLLIDDNLTEEQIESIEIIRDSGQKMRDMIDLSLDLFKMETGQYQYEAYSINLSPLLQQLKQVSDPKLSNKRARIQVTRDGATWSADTPLMVFAEVRLLFSLLSNLLTNAIEASPPGALIHLELATLGAELKLALHNQGTVPEAIRSHFFEKYRTHGKKGGTGLGTYSAKLMADTMGVSLCMHTSDADNSTCVTLILPIANH